MTAPIEDADVVALVASGELVPLGAWGEPPVRSFVVEAIRGRMQGRAWCGWWYRWPEIQRWRARVAERAKR